MLQYIPRHTGGAEPGDSVVRVRVRNAKSSKDIVSFIQECKKGVGRGEREREREDESRTEHKRTQGHRNEVVCILVGQDAVPASERERTRKQREG